MLCTYTLGGSIIIDCRAFWSFSPFWCVLHRPNAESSHSHLSNADGSHSHLSNADGSHSGFWAMLERPPTFPPTLIEDRRRVQIQAQPSASCFSHRAQPYVKFPSTSESATRPGIAWFAVVALPSAPRLDTRKGKAGREPSQTACFA